MKVLALVVAVVAIGAVMGCEKQKPPMTPDGPESMLGDAGAEVPEPAPAPSK